MKHKNYTKKDIAGINHFLLAFIILGCFAVTNSIAQVASYTFSQSNGTYTPITGGTVIATATGTGTSTDASLDQGNYSGNIGFTFNFNGTGYTTFNANGNGYITFGATLPTTSATTPISATTAYAGTVAAMARDLWGLYGSSGTRTLGSAVITGVTDFTGIAVGKPIRGTGISTSPVPTITAFDMGAGTVTMSVAATSSSTSYMSWPVGEIRVETIGTSPNRICVIQYSGMSDFATTAPTGNIMAWQIQLAEAGGVSTNQTVSIVYGPSANLSTTSRTQQVGLRGATNADFNNRSATTTWSGSTAGGTNAATITRTNTIFPASGLTFTWTPPNVCTGTPSAGTASTSLSSICVGNFTLLSLTGFTTGTTGITLQWQQSSTPGGPYTNVSGGTGATTATYTTPGLNANTYYVCKVTCTNSTLFALSNEVAISVTNPTVVSTTNGNLCGVGTTTIGAVPSAGATIKWYAAQTGGSPIGTGNSFTTPVISSTANYWAAATVGSTGNVGLSPTSTSCGTIATTSATDWPIRFNTTAPVTINTVDVIPNAAGSFVVALRNSLSSTNLQTASFTFTAAQVGIPQTISLGFTIAASGSYQITNTTGGGFRISTYTCTYPFVSAGGNFSIVGSATTSTSTTNTTTYNIFYNFNVSEGCESARTMVTANVTSAPAINSPTASQSVVCSGSAATLNISSANDPNYLYTWTPGNLTGNSVSVSPVTTTTYTVTAVDNSGGPNNGCTQIGTVTVSAQPATVSVSSSPESFCVTGGSATLNLVPATGYSANTIQWQSSPDNNTFTNIPSANSASYVTPSISSDTYYKAIITDGNNNICQQPSYALVINNPQVTGTTGATRCGIGTVTLGATISGASTVNWYANATGGLPLGTGTSFTTPVINAPTTFYAAAASAGSLSTHVGLPAAITTSSTGVGTTNFGLVFDVFTSFTLNTVTVYPVSSTNASGTITIDVINSAGTIVQSAVVSVTGSPSGAVIPQTVALNFTIPPGTNYKLRPRSFTGISSLLFEPSASAPAGGNYGYPFTVPGVVSILTSTLTAAPTNTARNDLYYYFYNWSISVGCESARQPVLADVTPAPNMTVSTSASAICPGGSADLTVISENDPNYTYGWTSNPAGFTASGAGPHNVTPSVTTTYIVTATDNTTGPNQGCVNIANVTVTNGGVLSAGTISSSLTDICVSGHPVLTASGASGGVFQWQQSTATASGPWTNVGTNSPTYDPGSVTQTTYYQLTVSCQSQSLSSNVVTVNVNNPQITGTTSASRCGAGTVTLSANANPGAIINWYAAPSGGPSLGTGNTFATPLISSPTNFYAGASNGFSQQNAMVGYSNTVGYSFLTQTDGWGLMFTANTNCVLDSVAVFPTGTGTISIEILSTSNTVLYTGPTVNISGTGTQKIFVPVGAILAPGNYKIGQNTTGVTNLGSQTTGTTMAYPFTSALATITSGSQGSGAVAAVYYWFYDLSFSATIGCEGTRVAVLADVTPSPVVNVTSGVSVVCQSGSTSVSVNSSNDPNYTYTWTSVPAGFTASGPGPHNVTLSTATSYNVYAVDNTAGPFNGCGAVGSVSVNAVANQIALNPTATPSSVCPHGNSQLLAGATIPGYTMNTNCNTSFIDISSSGTSIGTVSDDSEHNITIPTFTFNGVVYTNARVGMNGAIVFGSTSGDVPVTNAALPATTMTAGSAFIAPYWDDLDINQGATVKTQTIGSVFIIQWTNTDHNLFTTGTITFQVQLDLITGTITFIYPDATFGSATYDLAHTATIGIQFSTTSAIQYSFNTASIVDGQCISFSPVVPNLTYDWSVNPTYLTATNIANPVAQDVTANQTYSVTVHDVNTGCIKTQTLSLTVNALPVPTATNNSPVCVGQSLTLTANNTAAGQSSGNTYVWSGPNSFSSTNQNPVIASTVVASGGTYTVTVTNANGCVSSTTTLVNINTPPQIVSLQSATLNGGVAATFPPLPTFLDIPGFTTATTCDKVVNYTVNITGTPDPDEIVGGVSYTFTGATLGSGSGTGTGSAFGRLIPTGRTTVTINATNVCGSQSKQFRVTITDNVAPVITPIQVAPTGTNGGECSSLVQVTQPSLTNGGLLDNCPNATVVFVGRSDSRTQSEPYYAGTTTITWQATDASGNTSTATQNVVVNNTKPVITSLTSSAGPVIFVNQSTTYTTTFTDNDGGGPYTVKFYRDKNDASPANTKTLAYACYNSCTGITTYTATSDPITYTTSEVAEPKVEVLDGCNLAADQDPGITTYQYLAVAVAGTQFTTAGGHFTMPVGGYPSSYEGYDVSIGNVVKKATTGNSYKGQLEMNVHIPNNPIDWRVHTDNGTNQDITWDYLTIGGCTLATFKGAVRINGNTGYKVLVQQADKNANLATSNFIRVKVTTNSGTVMFDTQPGLTEALTSGNGGAAAIVCALTGGAVKVQPANGCVAKIENESSDVSIQNIPNPFTGQTEIRFTVPADGKYRLNVYNYLGQQVATLFDGEAAEGSVYSVTFDGSGMEAGIYTYTLRGATVNETRRMNLVR